MHHYMSIKIKNKIAININLSKLLSATMIYQLKESRRGCKKKKQPRSVNSEGFIAWLSSNICKPRDGIFEVRVCCLLPQRLMGKTSQLRKSSDPTGLKNRQAHMS